MRERFYLRKWGENTGLPLKGLKALYTVLFASTDPHIDELKGLEAAENTGLPLRIHKKDKSSNQRLSLNRSQYGGCSTEYNTVTSNQVVCK